LLFAQAAIISSRDATITQEPSDSVYRNSSLPTRAVSLCPTPLRRRKGLTLRRARRMLYTHCARTVGKITKGTKIARSAAGVGATPRAQ